MLNMGFSVSSTSGNDFFDIVQDVVSSVPIRTVTPQAKLHYEGGFEVLVCIDVLYNTQVTNMLGASLESQ